jgi:hypothetical protein
MEDKIFDIVTDLLRGDISKEQAVSQLLILYNVSGLHPWLDSDDLEFAKALQEENRLEAVKWLCEKAKPHVLTPLKTAKDILDAYR